MLVQESSQDLIKYDNLGFSIIDPLGFDCFIAWNTVDTIIFSPNRQGTDCAEWIIYLNEPPQWIKPLKMSWLSRFPFFVKDKKFKKQRIRDDINKDFYNFADIVKRYLYHTAEISYSEDYRKGSLVSSNTIASRNKIITKEYWKPKHSDELPWKMFYDRYQRTVNDIYYRDIGI
jgi:hypothetical protein